MNFRDPPAPLKFDKLKIRKTIYSSSTQNEKREFFLSKFIHFWRERYCCHCRTIFHLVWKFPRIRTVCIASGMAFQGMMALRSRLRRCTRIISRALVPNTPICTTFLSSCACIRHVMYVVFLCVCSIFR